MTNETLDIIKRRRSTRAFLPTQIGDEALAAIVEAGQYAPHGGSETWHFTAIQNAEILETLNRLAKQYTSTCGFPWLEDLGRNADFHSLYHAPTAILVSGDDPGVCSEADTAAASQNLLLAAESLGISACWVYFPTQAFLTDEGMAMRANLGIPEGYRVYTCVVLGYRAGEALAPAGRKAGTVTYIK